MRYPRMLSCLFVLVPLLCLGAEDAPKPEPAKAATEPVDTDEAQIVLKIGDREPVTLAQGQWGALQIIVAQVALAVDAMQWRELRARMQPAEQESSK